MPIFMSFCFLLSTITISLFPKIAGYELYDLMTFELCVALWAPLDGFENAASLQANPYAYQLARRRALSDWLSKYAKAAIDLEVQRATKKVCLEVEERHSGGEHKMFCLLEG